jgi:hypothetical protein
MDMSTADERQLWRVGRFTWVMISCCAGAELQVRAESAQTDPRAEESFAIVLRELYPTKSDLYERSHALRAEYAEAMT